MKKLIFTAVLALSGCNSAPTTETTEAVKPTIGAYMIVEGRNYNPKDLGPYAASLPPIYKKYDGHYVAFAPKFDVVEGSSDAQAIIVSAWPSIESAQAFWDSAEYAESKKLREGVGEFDVVILPALPKQ